jgi:hypothetical protein
MALNKQKGQKHADQDIEQHIYSCFVWEIGRYIMSEYWEALVEHAPDLPNEFDEDEKDNM